MTEITDKTKTIEFTTIEQGDFSGINKGFQNLITDSENWQDFWQQHKSTEQPPPPVPDVDFTKYQVVAVFAGEKGSSGYSVEITGVSRKEAVMSLEINYTMIATGGVIAVLTQPFHIIQIPQA